MRRFTEPTAPFRVVISPTGWRVVGSMPFEDFRAVCRALDAVAASVAQPVVEASSPEAVGPAPTEVRTLELVGYRVSYKLDVAQRTVTLLDIGRAG